MGAFEETWKFQKHNKCYQIFGSDIKTKKSSLSEGSLLSVFQIFSNFSINLLAQKGSTKLKVSRPARNCPLIPFSPS